ncbi:MAG: tetratricopeptide repeat protein, partial [Candidatus Latescibacteria bacterium]|nr:tetratricopeptide repeat protein [Candidatus Latescibacterota bacterium]
MKRVVFVFILIVMTSIPFSADSETPPRVLSRPVNTNPEFIKAQELEIQKKYEEAKGIYMRIYESQGTDIVFWKLVLLLERTKDFEEMERLTLQRLNKYRGEISTMRYLAHAYYGQGDKEKGRRKLLNIIGKRWDAAGRVSLVASELISQNDLDTALEVYTTARKKTGKDELFANEVARIYSIRMKYIDALEEYLKIIDRIKIAYTNIEQMIQKALEAGKKTDDIVRPIAEYLDSHPESINTARLLSGLMYDTGDFDRAYTVLITTAAATNNPRDVWNLAERLKKDGHLEKALMVYAGFYRYFENDPGRVSSLLVSASIKFILGDTDGAIMDYRNIVKDYQGTQEGDTASLRILQLSQDVAFIDELARSLNDFASTTKFRPVAREAYITLGEAFLRGGRAEEAEKAFEQARIKSRLKEEMYGVCVRKALLNFFTGDYEAMSQDIVNCVGY